MEGIFIEEEIYQIIKNKIGKIDNYFTKEELEKFYKNSGEIQAKFV